MHQGSLRRNGSTYLLVCCVNNITALLLSENYEPVPLFVARAAEHMKQVPASSGSEDYYDVVTRYLTQVAHHLTTHIGGIEFDDDRVPATILRGGFQEMPH